MPGLTITPMTIKAAIVFVREHHRHSKAPVGSLFAVGVADGGELVGVGIAGRPVASPTRWRVSRAHRCGRRGSW